MKYVFLYHGTGVREADDIMVRGLVSPAVRIKFDKEFLEGEGNYPEEEYDTNAHLTTNKEIAKNYGQVIVIFKIPASMVSFNNGTTPIVIRHNPWGFVGVRGGIPARYVLGKQKGDSGFQANHRYGGG